jgi:adenosylcobinamide kinase/adenosylcobinamide-phosphate guanylyltransferase
MSVSVSSLLVLGGARSGKSRYAQSRAEALDGQLVFVATAQAFDEEMTDRIARHRDDRGERWITVEEPLELPAVIVAHADNQSVLLVDCLTLWASNLLLADRDPAIAAREVADAIATARSPLMFVSNEVGLGIVPDNALARQFRDFAGTINQAVAAAVDEVVMVFAGIPMAVKGGRARP